MFYISHNSIYKNIRFKFFINFQRKIIIQLSLVQT